MNYVFNSSLDKDVHLIQTAMASVFDRADIQAAFADRDRETLLRLARPLYDRYTGHHHITHFYFMTPDRKVLLRVHQPERGGDVIDRKTMLQAEASGKMSWGAELGVFGTYTLRVVVPWRVDGRLIGYVEMGEEIDHIVEEIQRGIGLDVFKLIHKRFLQRENWEVGRAFTGGASDWSAFDDFVLSGSSPNDVTKKIGRQIALNALASGKPSSFFSFDDGGVYKQIGMLPLTDVGKGEIGRLVLVRDYSVAHQALKTSVVQTALAVMLIGTAIFLAFYVVLGGAQRKLIQAESSLLETNAELSEKAAALSEAQAIASMGSWSLDLQKNKLSWSDEIFRIFGMDRSSFEPSYEGFLSTIHPDDLDMVNTAFTASMEGEKPYDIRHRIVRKDNGEVRWVHERCEHDRNAAGEIIRSNGTVQDVTQLEQVEQKLASSERQLKLALDHLPGALVLTDKDLKILLRSDDFPALYDVPRALLEPGSDYAIFLRYLAEHGYYGEGDVDALVATRVAALRNPKDEMFEDIRPDGHVFGVTRKITDEGHTITVVTDITELKRVHQVALEEKDAALKASRAKSEFLSTVSHELRTPLTSIRGSLTMMDAKFKDDLPAKAGTMLDLANRNVKILGGLIDDLLDLEKIQSGTLDIQMESVDIRALIIQAVEVNQAYAQRMGVSIALGDMPTEPLSMLLDEKRITQVLANLISNAAKFSPDGEQVVMSLGHYDLEGNGQTRPGVRVSVADKGPGIPEEFHSRIFEPFAQADSTTTRKIGGTGLGLSICKVIAEQHQGDISFETGHDKGTVFHLDLPLDPSGTGAST